MGITASIEPEIQNLRDLGLVAALVASGFVIDRDIQENGYISFVFTSSKALERAVDDYWSDRLSVSARSYFETTKMLKSRIYGKRQSNATH